MKLVTWQLAIIWIIWVNSIRSEHLFQQTIKSIADRQEIEKNILVELFQSTNGYSWTRKDDWLSLDVSICQWRGVLCDNNSNVIGLDLYSNRLSGTIPESIGQLVNLQMLNLHSNRLSGTIPYSIGQLVNLQRLSLYSNQLNGTIPDSIGNLTNVQLLYLYINRLSGTIPESIGRLASIQRLFLYSNNLGGSIPESLGQLNTLLGLSLQSNQLSGTIPNTIIQLVNLQRLYLHSNQLSGTIPDSIGRLVLLQNAYLYSNQLNGTIPDSIGNLPYLLNLYLYGNQLSGTIPESIGRLRSLQVLDLSFNQLKGTIPEAIGNLAMLQRLHLEYNQLSGTFPDSVGRLRSIQEISAYSNQQSGTIPTSIGQLIDLKILKLSSNHFNGTIPISLWSLKSLKEIYLGYNELTGTISDVISDLRALKILDLSNNDLYGTLPNLESLSSLNRIGIAENYFHGCLSFPKQFTNTSHATCNVQGNDFCCSKYRYSCFEVSCPIEDTLIITNGAKVQYNHNKNNRNIIILEGGVLLLDPKETLDIDCFTLEGELQIMTNVTLTSTTFIRSECQLIDNITSKITSSSTHCKPKIVLLGNELRGPIICSLPEDTTQRDVIIIITTIVGSAVISSIIAVIILIRRRRRRINQLKSRVELLTLSSTKLNKGSSPPEDFQFKLLEDLPIKISKTNFNFGHQGNLFIVDKEFTDSFIIEVKNAKHHAKLRGPLYDTLINKRTLVQFRPVSSSKYRLAIDPQGFELPHSSSVEVKLRLTLMMTTKTKVSSWIELPEEQVYSLIEFDAASEPSPWIDVEEVEIEGDAIGEGGFGAVYKAHYRGQQVAYKTLKLQDLGHQFYKEFDQEVRMMMNLHHKNIVQFIGASRVKGKLAILTEFVAQGNLQSLLSTKRLDSELKKKIILDIAEVLRFLHSNNILHRDIKAENILVVSTLIEAIVNVKLTDFGTARSTTEQVTSKFTKGVGTPIYMAVEILKNENYERSADVYSFGVLMWTIMTQEEPYKDMTHSWDIAEFVLQGKRLPIPDDCPMLFKNLITKCWAQNPQDRPTMKEVVYMLSNDENLVELDNIYS